MFSLYNNTNRRNMFYLSIVCTINSVLASVKTEGNGSKSVQCDTDHQHNRIGLGESTSSRMTSSWSNKQLQLPIIAYKPRLKDAWPVIYSIQQNVSWNSAMPLPR